MVSSLRRPPIESLIDMARRKKPVDDSILEAKLATGVAVLALLVLLLLYLAGCYGSVF